MTTANVQGDPAPKAVSGAGASVGEAAGRSK